MAHRRPAGIFATVLLNMPFGNEPSPLHFRFQAASEPLQSAQPEKQNQHEAATAHHQYACWTRTNWQNTRTPFSGCLNTLGSL